MFINKVFNLGWKNRKIATSCNLIQTWLLKLLPIYLSHQVNENMKIHHLHWNQLVDSKNCLYIRNVSRCKNSILKQSWKHTITPFYHSYLVYNSLFVSENSYSKFCWKTFNPSILSVNFIHFKISACDTCLSNLFSRH